MKIGEHRPSQQDTTRKLTWKSGGFGNVGPNAGTVSSQNTESRKMSFCLVTTAKISGYLTKLLRLRKKNNGALTIHVNIIFHLLAIHSKFMALLLIYRSEERAQSIIFYFRLWVHHTQIVQCLLTCIWIQTSFNCIIRGSLFLMWMRTHWTQRKLMKFVFSLAWCYNGSVCLVTLNLDGRRTQQKTRHSLFKEAKKGHNHA